MKHGEVYEEVRLGLASLYPRLWRYCLVVTGNPENASDIAQTACERALGKAEQFTSGTKLDRWVFRIAQRVWLNELRSKAVRRGGGMVPLDDVDLPDTAVDTEASVLSRQVLVAAMALPEAQRTTMILVYVEGYSYREASDILDIPIGTVMSRLASARVSLSKKLRSDRDSNP